MSGEHVEGPEARKRFDAEVKTLLGVPHDEIVRREKEYQAHALQNPRKRGPKPKGVAKGSTSDHAASEG